MIEHADQRGSSGKAAWFTMLQFANCKYISRSEANRELPLA